MALALELITPAADRPLELEAAKLHLRVTHAGADEGLLEKIDAAVAQLYDDTRRVLVTSTWHLHLDTFPADEVLGELIRLPIGPTSSVTHVKYYDADGVLQTLDPSKYQVDTTSELARVLPVSGQSWPSIQARRLNAVQVGFVAGGAVAAVPKKAIQALKLLIGQMYEHRELVVTGTIVAAMPANVAAAYESLVHGLRVR